jgi:L-ascorbate metabolism protein UlaG (beta-lactamase superfamily)
LDGTAVIVHKLGHACLLVETGDARILVDPGCFSSGFENLEDLTAVLVTHAHPDHLDMERIGDLLARNPQANVFCDHDSASQLKERKISSEVVKEGDVLRVPVEVEVVGSAHAVIHRDLPRIANYGYLIDGRFFHPGDALTVPDRQVEVLGVPIGAPWLKCAEVIDYLRLVKPKKAVPIHDAVLAVPQMVHGLVAELGPEGLDYQVVDDGSSLDLDA